MGAGNLRLNTEDIANSPCLIAVLLVCLANGVDIVYTNNPLVLGKFDLSAEVVHVADERAQDNLLSGFGIGAHEINDSLCEVGVEFAGAIGAVGSVSGHLVVV